MKEAPERLEQHRGHSAASHLRFRELLSSLVSWFVDDAARFVSDKVAAHPVRLTGVLASASDSLKLDLHALVELLRTARRGGQGIYNQLQTARNFIFHSSGYC